MLAAFYQRLLGWETTAKEPDWVLLRPAEGGVGLAFQSEPDHQRPPWPAVQRRQSVEREADVDYTRRADGLVDIHAYGIAAPAAHALLSRIRDRAQPAGPGDDRTAGQRRRDALIELLRGRPAADQQTGGCPGGQSSGACPARPCRASLSPAALEHEMRHPTDWYWHDPDADTDRLREQLLDRGSRWTLHLDDHTAWDGRI